MTDKPPCVEQCYFTRKGAAQMLCCSDQTISKLHKAGRLPFYYLGRHAVRIRIDDVIAMLSTNPTVTQANSEGRLQ